jgi:hypothetical protein
VITKGADPAAAARATAMVACASAGVPEGSRCCPACDAPFDSGVLMPQTVAAPHRGPQSTKGQAARSETRQHHARRGPVPLTDFRLAGLPAGSKAAMSRAALRLYGAGQLSGEEVMVRSDIYLIYSLGLVL